MNKKKEKRTQKKDYSVYITTHMLNTNIIFKFVSIVVATITW